MAETRINESTHLKCACGGDLFVPLVKLKHHVAGGTSTEPAGHWCVACQAVVDNRYMAQLIERQRKQEEIRRLQAEVGDVPTPPRSVAPHLTLPPKAATAS